MKMAFFHLGKKTKTAGGGFSLPEVAIAIAIAAIAIAVLMGLMPQGLESMREAGATTAQSSIFRQLFAEVQSADWGQSGGAVGWTGLSSYNDQRRYYDDQGTRIEEGDSASLETRLSYVARLSFSSQVPKVPGAETGYDGATQNMLFLTIQISDVPVKDYDFTEGRRHKSRTMVITRQHSTGAIQ